MPLYPIIDYHRYFASLRLTLFLSYIGSAILLLGTSSCTNEHFPEDSATTTTGDPVLDEIRACWAQVLKYDREKQAEILVNCRKIDSLSRINPVLYADYLVGAQAITCFYYSNLSELEDLLYSAEQSFLEYQDYLSDSLQFQTGINIKYQICRKMDLVGDIGDALQCYQEVWNMLPDQHHDQTQLENFRQALPYSIAHLYLFLGSYKRAQDWVNILKNHLQGGYTIYSSLYHHLSGRLYEILGNVDAAKVSYETATEHYKLAENLTKSPLFIENNVTHSDLFLESGRLDRAALIMDQVLEYGPFDGFNAAFLYHQLAKIYLASDQPDAALEAGQKTLRSVEQIGLEKYFWKGRALSVIGQGLAKKGNWLAALDALQLALYHFSGEEFKRGWDKNPLPRSSDTKLDLLKALIAKASILEQAATDEEGNVQELLEASLNARVTAVELIKILRAEYNEDEVKEYLSSSAFPVFEAAIGTALRLHDRTQDNKYLEDAFYFFETGKGLSLLENLRGLQARMELQVPEDLIAKERDLKYKITILERTLRESADDPTRMRDLQDLLAVTRDNYEALIELLRRDYAEYFDRKYNFQTATLEDIRLGLDADEGMVEFFYGEQNIYVLLVTLTGFQVNIIPRTDVFDQKLDRFTQLVGSRLGFTGQDQIHQYQEDGHWLYNQLFGSFHLYTKKLILIPDGPLHYLPFNALLTDNSAVRDPRNLPYLVKKHIIRRNFSASVWQQQRQSPRISGKGGGRILVIAPEIFPDSNNLPLDKPALQAAFGENVEIEASPSKEKVIALFGKGYDKIFIFTHAAASDTEPYLQLKNDSLFLHELYTIPIRANLVLLSACETGLGKQQLGEGVMSIGRGFAYQNVPNAIMTLWEVQHRYALQISMDMLQQLTANPQLTPSEALWSAQLQLIRKTTGAPFQWAGFVCTGE